LKEHRGSSGERLVLLKNVHDASSPVSHVLGDHEGEVASLNLFVVEDRRANSVSGPPGISGVSKLVSLSFKHGDGDLDVLNRD